MSCHPPCKPPCGRGGLTISISWEAARINGRETVSFVAPSPQVQVAWYWAHQAFRAMFGVPVRRVSGCGKGAPKNAEKRRSTSAENAEKVPSGSLLDAGRR